MLTLHSRLPHVACCMRLRKFSNDIYFSRQKPQNQRVDSCMPLGCHAHTLAIAVTSYWFVALMQCTYSASLSSLSFRRTQPAFYFNFAHPVALHTFRRIHLYHVFLQHCTQILACGQHLSVINAASNLFGIRICVRVLTDTCCCQFDFLFT